MSGMGSTLQLTNSTVVAAFRSALIHQGIIALLIFFLLAMLWISVREWVPGHPRHHPAGRRPGRRRAAGPAGDPDRLRRAVDLRRPAPGAARDAARPAQQRDRAGRGELAWLGAAAGGLRRAGLDVSPGQRGRGRRLDPGRHRHLAAHRRPRPLVQARRAGQRGLGPGRLGLRRGVRRHLRPGAELAVRRARVRRCCTPWPGRSSRCPAGPGPGRPAGPDGARRAPACSSPAWPCCRPGRGAGSGPGTAGGRRAT